MSKIVVLEWVTSVAEEHRAEVAFDRLPRALQDAIGTRKVPGGTRAMVAYDYLPDIEGAKTLTQSTVTERQLYDWNLRDE